MPSHFGGHFDSSVRFFRKFVAFRVRTVDGKPNSEFAHVRETPRGWLIVVDRNQEVDSACDCLMHEVAHILDWAKNGYDEDEGKQHRRSWGVIYSDLYRKYHEACNRGEI